MHKIADAIEKFGSNGRKRISKADQTEVPLYRGSSWCKAAIVWRHLNGPNRWAKRFIRVAIKTRAASDHYATTVLLGITETKAYVVKKRVLPGVLTLTEWQIDVGEADPPLATYDEILLVVCSPNYVGWWVQSEGYQVEMELSVIG